MGETEQRMVAAGTESANRDNEEPRRRSLTITWAGKVAVVNSRSAATRYMLES